MDGFSGGGGVHFNEPNFEHPRAKPESPSMRGHFYKSLFGITGFHMQFFTVSVFTVRVSSDVELFTSQT